MDLIELDELVLKMSGRKSINEIFDLDGEDVFRKLELEAVGSLRNSTNAVISTGGGVVQNKLILTLLKRNGKVFYLNTSFSEIENRLVDDHSRPLFKNRQKAEELYSNRLKMYENSADKIINTESKNIDQVAQEIIDAVK